MEPITTKNGKLSIYADFLGYEDNSNSNNDFFMYRTNIVSFQTNAKGHTITFYLAGNFPAFDVAFDNDQDMYSAKKELLKCI